MQNKFIQAVFTEPVQFALDTGWFHENSYEELTPLNFTLIWTMCACFFIALAFLAIIAVGCVVGLIVFLLAKAWLPLALIALTMLPVYALARRILRKDENDILEQKGETES